MKLTQIPATLAAAALGAASLSLLGGCATDLDRQQVPATVLNAFDTSYPDARDIVYERKTMNGRTVYEVDFENGNGDDMEVTYNENGLVLEYDD